jgi:hypothetical protein
MAYIFLYIFYKKIKSKKDSNKVIISGKIHMVHIEELTKFKNMFNKKI